MPIYQNPNITILNEVTIGNCGDNYRVDITPQRGAHGPRVKIARKSGNSHDKGTSAPVLYDADPAYYKDVRYHKGIETCEDSYYLLPLVVGFATIFRFELIDYLNKFTSGMSNDANIVRESLRYEWKNFYNAFKRASEGQIRDYTNKCVDARMKRASIK